MKGNKYIVLILLALSIGSFAFAQIPGGFWIPDDDDNYVEPIDEDWGLYVQGEVGIGDSTPDAVLEITTNSSAGAYFMVSSNAAGDGDYFIVDSSGNTGIGGDLSLQDDQWLYFDTAKTNGLRYVPAWADTIYNTAYPVSTEGELNLTANMGADGLGTGSPYLYFGEDGGAAIGNNNVGNVVDRVFTVDMTSGMYVKRGNTGLGDNTPDATLEITTSSLAEAYFMISSDAAGDGDIFTVDGNGDFNFNAGNLTTTGNIGGTTLIGSSSIISPLIFGGGLTGGTLSLVNNAVDLMGVVIGTNVSLGALDLITTGNIIQSEGSFVGLIPADDNTDAYILWGDGKITNVIGASGFDIISWGAGGASPETLYQTAGRGRHEWFSHSSGGSGEGAFVWDDKGPDGGNESYRWKIEGTDVLVVNNAGDFDYKAGNLITTGDISGDTLTITDPVVPWKITKTLIDVAGNTELGFQPQTVGAATRFGIFPSVGANGSENVFLHIYGRGSPTDRTNEHRVDLGWVPSTDYYLFQIPRDFSQVVLGEFTFTNDIGTIYEISNTTAEFIFNGPALHKNNVEIQSGDLFFTGDSGGLPYGSMYMHEATQTIDLVVNNYVKITGFTSGHLNNVTIVSDSFRVAKIGVYKIDWSISGDAAANNEDLEFAIFVNGSEEADGNARTHSQVTGHDEFSISGTALIDITNIGYDIDLRIKNLTSSNDIDLYHANFNIVQIGSTRD